MFWWGYLFIFQFSSQFRCCCCCFCFLHCLFCRFLLRSAIFRALCEKENKTTNNINNNNRKKNNNCLRFFFHSFAVFFFSSVNFLQNANSVRHIDWLADPLNFGLSAAPSTRSSVSRSVGLSICCWVGVFFFYISVMDTLLYTLLYWVIYTRTYIQTPICMYDQLCM